MNYSIVRLSNLLSKLHYSVKHRATNETISIRAKMCVEELKSILSYDCSGVAKSILPSNVMDTLVHLSKLKRYQARGGDVYLQIHPIIVALNKLR